MQMALINVRKILNHTGYEFQNLLVTFDFHYSATDLTSLGLTDMS
jgi:hypothetical protein